MGEAIAAEVRGGMDPLNKSRLYSVLLNNATEARPITGAMHWLPNGFRAGTLALKNWFLPRTTAPNGTILYGTSPSLSIVGFCNLNICALRDNNSVQWSSSRRPNENEGTILKIGMAYHEFSNEVEQWIAAAQWAVNIANTEVLTFYQLRLHFVPLQLSPPDIIETVEKFKARSSPSVIVGPEFSSDAKLVAATMQASRIPVITPSATDTELSNEFYYRYFSRVGDNDFDAATATLGSMKQFRWFAFAALSSDDDKASIDEIAKIVPSDMKMVAQESFALNGDDALDLVGISNSLEKIRLSGARIIVYSSHPTTILTVLRVAQSKSTLTRQILVSF